MCSADPAPGSTAAAAAEAAKKKKKIVSGTTLMGRPRSKSRDGATGTSILDTTSVSSIGSRHIYKVGGVL